MLTLHSEEAGAENFFPEIKSGGIPVLTNVRQVVGDDWPDDILSFLGLSVFQQPVAVSDQCDGSERWAISLRSSPSAVKSFAIDEIFRFSESETLREQTSRRVADSLEDSLRVDVIVNVGFKFLLAEDKLVD